jgi:hypothetical protein
MSVIPDLNPEYIQNENSDEDSNLQQSQRALPDDTPNDNSNDNPDHNLDDSPNENPDDNKDNNTDVKGATQMTT